MSDNNNTNTNDDDNGNGVLGGTPISWIFVPLVGVIIFAATLTILLIRRRRRQRALYGNGAFAPPGAARWPGGGRGLGYYSHGTHLHQHRGGSRWNPWGATRSQDGLNEFGEAPPPYIGKKNGGKHQEGDIELGVPPEYHVAGPAPAVTTESRRNLPS